jgi:outer membrane protein OmpA-like peptidoglycan-associated protein
MRFGLLAMFVLVAALPARAEGPFQLERYRPALDRHGILDVESAATLEDLEIEALLTVGYAHNPLVLYAREPAGLTRAGALVGARVGTDLVLSAGLFGFFELGLDVPVVVFQARGAVPAGLSLPPLAIGGLGDVRLSPKLRFLRAQDVGVDVAFMPTVTAPTALPDGAYLGEKFFTFAPELLVSRSIFGVRFAVDVGGRIRSVSRSAGVLAGQEVTYRGGIAVPLAALGVKAPIELDASLGGALTVAPTFGAQAPFEALVGAKTRVGAVELFAAGGAGLLPGPGVPDFRVLAGLRFSAIVGDGDGDGFDDDVDKCPDRAEDRDGIQDDDGCPDEDADYDGFLDTADLCPLEAEDRDDFEDVDGCPDVDDDHDGVPDTKDGCPRVPGDAKWRGCRPPDRDADRVPDAVDQCPLEAGPGSSDGCPASNKLEAAQRTELATRVVFFGYNSASVEGEGKKVVDRIAELMTLLVDVRLRIEGHSEDSGVHEYNLEVSKKRANAVRKALIQRGIDGARLEAVGMGADSPRGAKAAVRAHSRRVEVHLEAAAAPQEKK